MDELVDRRTFSQIVDLSWKFSSPHWFSS